MHAIHFLLNSYPHDSRISQDHVRKKRYNSKCNNSSPSTGRKFLIFSIEAAALRANITADESSLKEKVHASNTRSSFDRGVPRAQKYSPFRCIFLTISGLVSRNLVSRRGWVCSKLRASYSKEMFSAYGYTIITDDFIVWELEFINL